VPAAAAASSTLVITLLAAGLVARAWTQKQGHVREQSRADPGRDAEHRHKAGEWAPLRAACVGLPVPLVIDQRLQAEATQGHADEHRRGERDEGDDQCPVQAQRGEHGRHDQRADRVAGAAAHREDAHVCGHPAARGMARPARTLGMIAGHPGAAHGDGDQREGEARGHSDGADADAGDDEPGGQQPV
jgi:hypothetical protein